MFGRSARVMAAISVVLMIPLAACQQVGPALTQKPDSIVDSPIAPSQTRMVDKERGTLSTSGTGPTTWKRLDADGVETTSTGVAPRSIYWDNESKRFVLDSGSDVTAEDVSVGLSADGTQIKVGRLTTLTSPPTRAVNEAYAQLVGYWTSLSADQKEAHLGDLKAMTDAGDTFAPVLLKLLSGI